MIDQANETRPRFPDRLMAGLRPLLTLWERVTRPSAAIQKRDAQRRARLLSGLLLVLIVVGLLSVLAWELWVAPIDTFRRTEFFIEIGTLALLDVIYIVSRTRHYTLAALLTIGVPSLAVFGVAASTNEPDSGNMLAYLLVPVVACTLFLSLQATALLIGLDLAGIVLFSAVSGGEGFWNPWIGFTILTSVAILFTSYYHALLEQDRQAALRESEEKFRLIFENAFDGISIHEDILLDESHRIRRLLDCNARYAEMAGRSKEELLHVNDTLAIQRGLGPLRSPEQEIALLREAKPHQGFFSWIRPDGQENTIEYRAQPIRIGSKTLIVGLDRDITERARIENALRESEERYRLLVESSDAAISSMNWDGTFLFMNGAAARDLGGKPEDFVGQTVFELFPPSMAERHTAAVRRVIEAGQGTVIEAPTFVAGEPRWHRTSLQPIRDGTGTVSAALVIAYDITERKNAESARVQSEVRYRELFNSMTSGVAVYEPSPDGSGLLIKDMNEAGQRISRVKKVEIIGKDVREVFPGVEALGLWDVFRQVQESGLPAHYPTALYQDNRLSFWVENHVYRLPSGEIVAVYDDVSEHKRAEEALRRHDAILKAAAFSAERFLTVPDWEQSIQEVLEQVGQAAGVERVYIFENERANDGTLLTSQRFEWAGPGVPSQMDDPRFIDIAWQASGFGRWEETLSRGKPIVGHVRDFPPSEQAVLSSQGILSLLDVPIFAGQHWWGFIGFDECRAEREWTDQEIEAVTVAANTLGAAIQRQQAEQALRESEDKYRQLFEIESDAIFLIDNESGNILEANPAAERLYGYSRNELLQMKHTDLSAEPERTRLAVKTRQERIPVRYHRKKDGTPVTVEISGGYLVWHGREAHVAAIRDITERQRAEAALRESEEKFRSIVEQSHDGVTLTDQNGVLVEWNRAAETITGLTRDAVSGRYAWDVQFSLLPEEKRTPALYEHMKLVGMNLLKKEDRLSTPGRPSEHEIRSRDGTRKVLQSVAFQIKEEAGFMVCGILRDITEQKRAQDQRLKLSVEQEKVKLLSSFVRDVSHEFRMPLSVVYTGLEVLERATALDDASVQRVGIIKAQALYIADLVDAMLLMARLDSDPQFAFSPVDLSVLARDVGIEMGTLLQKKAQTLTLDLADSLPVVQADPSKLRHALVNLCENAVQFTPDMGSITLRTYTRGEYAVIEVADTGIGLDDHDLPYIFERFYRADQARTERHAGLGLSIAQKIVEAHQGRIEVESAPGQGSTFRIVLPVVVG